MDSTAWSSARVQRSKGRPSECSQSKRWSRVGCHLSLCLMASCRPQREPPGWLACKHVAFTDILSTSSHYLWVEVVTFCGPGLEATTAMKQRGKGRSRGRKVFASDSLLADTVLGSDTTRCSESAPVNHTAIHTRAFSRRAVGEPQGHTLMLAKHITCPQVGREDPDMTIRANEGSQTDCAPDPG